MYLYVLTYWCQKSTHQKCHIDSQLQRKSLSFFLPITSIEKLCTEKGHDGTSGSNEASANKQKLNLLNSYSLGALNFKLYIHSEKNKRIHRLLTPGHFERVLRKKKKSIKQPDYLFKNGKWSGNTLSYLKLTLWWSVKKVLLWKRDRNTGRSRFPAVISDRKKLL